MKMKRPVTLSTCDLVYSRAGPSKVVVIPPAEIEGRPKLSWLTNFKDE
jgi:hypothetical protein